MRNRKKNPSSALLLILLTGAFVGYYMYSKAMPPSKDEIEAFKKEFQPRTASIRNLLKSRADEFFGNLDPIPARLYDVYARGTDLRVQLQDLKAIRAEIPTGGSRLYISTTTAISAIQDYLDFYEAGEKKFGKLEG